MDRIGCLAHCIFPGASRAARRASDAVGVDFAHPRGMEETTLTEMQAGQTGSLRGDDTASASSGVASGAASERASSSLVHRLTPRAPARVQLVLASIVWLVGAAILAVRGVIYLSRSHWAAWLIALALVIGVAKGRLILERVARKAVERIRLRGRERCLFGFFSWKSWLLIVVMMGGGIMLRRSGAPPAFLGVLYVAVATALLYGDHQYWLAAIHG